MKKVTKYTAIVVALVLLGSAAQTFGMVEAWGTYGDRFLTLQGGTTVVGSGALLEIGILGTTEANMIANQNNIAFLAANFLTWQTSTVGSNFPLDGGWDTTSSVPSGNGTWLGQQIYVLAFNAATAGAATQVGLFTIPGNKFPSSDVSAAGTWDLGDPGLTAVIGTLGTGTIVGGILDGLDSAALHLVPEPSSIALAGLGLLGLIGLIRRRS
jgi:hypothetical protein